MAARPISRRHRAAATVAVLSAWLLSSTHSASACLPTTSSTPLLTNLRPTSGSSDRLLASLVPVSSSGALLTSSAIDVVVSAFNVVDGKTPIVSAKLSTDTEAVYPSTFIVPPASGRISGTELIVTDLGVSTRVQLPIKFTSALYFVSPSLQQVFVFVTEPTRDSLIIKPLGGTVTTANRTISPRLFMLNAQSSVRYDDDSYIVALPISDTTNFPCASRVYLEYSSSDILTLGREGLPVVDRGAWVDAITDDLGFAYHTLGGGTAQTALVASSEVQKFLVCAPNPCLNNGTCAVSTSSSAVCTCTKGYRGTLCDTTVCTSTYCKNGGTCSVSTTNTAVCTCTSKYTGPTCTTAVASNPISPLQAVTVTPSTADPPSPAAPAEITTPTLELYLGIALASFSKANLTAALMSPWPAKSTTGIVYLADPISTQLGVRVLLTFVPPVFAADDYADLATQLLKMKSDSTSALNAVFKLKLWTITNLDLTLASVEGVQLSAPNKWYIVVGFILCGLGFLTCAKLEW
eukprot:TRINITY_DN4989_c0_g1_i1.p1 TRINITY_DN4989_c0_g1~~TRINITY_DN4989_c0_g1_i1.p1  ORF type:complete len:520 (+),score=85.62 TRINITY_DN4989_c0_g1_i1:64-1623(+)